MRQLRRTFAYIQDLKLEKKGIILEWTTGQQTPLSNWLLQDLDPLLPKTNFNPDLITKSVTLKDNSNSLLINWSDGKQSVLQVEKLHRLATGTYYALPRAVKSEGLVPRRVKWAGLELTAEVAVFLEELFKKGAIIVKHHDLQEVMQKVFGTVQEAQLSTGHLLRTYGTHLTSPPSFLGINTRNISLVDSITLTEMLPNDTKDYMSKLPVTYRKGNYFAAHMTLRGFRVIFDQEMRAEHCYPAAFYKHWYTLLEAIQNSSQSLQLAADEIILLDNSRFLHSINKFESAYAVGFDDGIARVRELLNPLK